MKYSWSTSPRILFSDFFKINHDSFAAPPSTGKYTREIRSVPCIYVKEIWCVVPESTQDPMEVLHKQLYKPPHTSCLA